MLHSQAKDYLGCRVGSQAATVNALLGAKPLTVKAAAATTGFSPGSIKSHLKRLERDGLVTSKADGYLLVKKVS